MTGNEDNSKNSAALSEQAASAWIEDNLASESYADSLESFCAGRDEDGIVLALRMLVERYVMAEREECARSCDDAAAGSMSPEATVGARACANLIRARGAR